MSQCRSRLMWGQVTALRTRAPVSATHLPGNGSPLCSHLGVRGGQVPRGPSLRLRGPEQSRAASGLSTEASRVSFSGCPNAQSVLVCSQSWASLYLLSAP